VSELAQTIGRDYADAEDGILLIGVLKGAFIFLADLARALPLPNAVDFLALSSYGANGATRGAVRIVLDLRASIRGRHVLIVEDIVERATRSPVRRMLAVRQPASLALVIKPGSANDVPVKYRRVRDSDVWVVVRSITQTSIAAACGACPAPWPGRVGGRRTPDVAAERLDSEQSRPERRDAPSTTASRRLSWLYSLPASSRPAVP
jgi:hypoxanthine phosphoribosyltransferase